MGSPNTAGGARPPLHEAVAWAYVAIGGGMVVALVALRESPLSALPVAIMGVTAALSALVGRVRNRPRVTLPWTLFGAACAAFIVGAVLRQVLAQGAAAPLADLATLSGYAATLAGYVALLRSRRSPRRALHELVDGMVLLVSAGSVALVVFTLPTVAAGHSSGLALLQGAYPVVDVAVLFVAVLLCWTSANRVPSFWLLAGAITGMLAGDVGYAYIGTQGRLVGSPLMDLPFVIAFTFFGAAALHPSMSLLSDVQGRTVQAWSRGRLAVLVPALLLPLVIVVTDDSRAAGWIGALAGSAVMLLLLRRAVGAVHDHAQSQEGLRYQAEHDPLTGLVNRPSLVYRVDALIHRAERERGRVDLLFLDIDSFKLVNDSWGHQMGDQVLRVAATRLSSVTQSSDVVARIGGDEFVVARYVGPSGVGSGQELAGDIIDVFRVPLPESENALVATVSVGLARSSSSATAEGMLRDADTAMYRAKAAGRNRCVTFDHSMHDSVRARVETELALRHALDRDEFLLNYQPIVSLISEEVVGVEALLRWSHPGMGMIPPLDFIPVAEETGLIVEIGEWVVSEALRQLARWRTRRSEAGLPDLWVSVNVSARQLRDPSLVEHVEAELARHGVPPELLVLEITESAMMADEDTAAALLGRLRRLGVTLAVDDFGTGYSSLGHLRRFPVSKVKIDRAFVSGIAEDADDAEIVRAVVAMSLAMRLSVVAEGIETEGQRALLAQLGVPLGQGWLFGRPEPAEDCHFVLGQPARLKS
ncbi:MAG: putative bifunctional diguanylate cyclase/phosphodiesterase [Actinomycetes bacterium]